MQHKESERKQEAQLTTEIELIKRNSIPQKNRLLAYARGIKQLVKKRK